ncbi:aromatic ring-hydroxylating dioxygenase subunit alpha [bacterium AH-315-F18]|nr:aromatic ring-hydroxylating dioxygenase subunit alpha [bacterium AH-315-F18]
MKDPLSLNEKLQGFDASLPIECAWMPPASWYTDGDFLALERDQIFRQTWQPVARLDQLQEDHSYVTGVLVDTPWVITRGAGGPLRAFYNVCRHKGREVVRGCGKIVGDELVCGYHAWRYHLDGTLKAAPKMGGIRNFEKGDMGLVPMAVEAWGNWVFINGHADAAPLRPELSELERRLNERDWRRPKFHATKEWIIQCNWKVFADNYLDGGYHIPHMHPTLNAQLDMENYRTECFETFSIQSSPANPSAGARIGAGSIYAWLFPNFMINLYGDCLDTNYVTPLGEHKCHVRYEFYFTEACDESFIATSIQQSDVTQLEDIEICESVQRGLHSGAYLAGRYSPQLEMAEFQFHKMLAQRLRRSV